MKTMKLTTVFLFAIFQFKNVKSTAPTLLSSQEGCEHDGVTRKNGETWKETGNHSNGINWTSECMQCYCNINIVMCTIRSCPSLTCNNPISVKQSCCLVCPDSEDDTIEKGCVHLSSSFGVKASWKVYIPDKNKRGSCAQCLCLKGLGEPQEVCEQYRCPELRCLKMIGKPGECCGTCEPGSPEVKKFKGPTIFDIFQTLSTPSHESDSTENKKEEEKQKDCKFGSEIYKNKEVYIPAVMSDCLRCMCEDGIIRCKKIICPETQNCPSPQNRSDLCCNICRGTSKDKTRALALDELKPEVCPPTNESLVQVYEYQSNIVDFARFLFDRSCESNKSSEIHTVRAKDLKIEVVVQKINLEKNNLDIIYNTLTQYKYIGSIKKKILARFIKKENELKQATRQDFTKLIERFKDTIREKSGKKKSNISSQKKKLPLD